MRGSAARAFLEAQKRKEERARRLEESRLREEARIKEEIEQRYRLETQRRQEEIFSLRPKTRPAPPTPEPPLEERVPTEKTDYVEEAVEKISTDIQPALEFALGGLEDTIGRFTYSATDNDIRGMKEELENFSRGMEIVKDLLGDFHREIAEVIVRSKKRSIDVQAVINRTFNKETTEEEVRELLDLLHRTSEDTMRVRYDVPESKELAVLLQSVFDYGATHFDYEAPEVMVEMDVSKDEEVAQKLAESMQKEERRVRFESFDEPTERIGGSVPRIRRIPTTVPPAPLLRSAPLSEARTIVREHPEIDRGTMKEILVSKGFSTDVIRESLRTKSEAREASDLVREHLVRPLRAIEPIPRKDTPPPGEGVDLTGLSFGDVRDIAELYSLPAYEGMSKFELIAHIQRNIDKTILRDILRERFSKADYEFKNIPIIYSE